jgi:DnaA family protein
LQAACLEAGRNGRRAAYLPLAERHQLMPAVLEGLEALDLVCVDDLDRVCGVEEWEHGLFHLFNRMRDARRSLLFAADRAPAALPVALADLGSRLAWDLVFHVEALDEAGRFSALSHRARLLGMEIPEEVLSWLARRVPRDPRTLFSLLERLDRASLAAQRKLTVPFVRELIEGS